MLRMIAVHMVDRPDRLPLPDDWEVWEVDTPIGQTYQEIAVVALENNWDHQTIVIQDDVRFDENSTDDWKNLFNYSVIAYGNNYSVIAYGQTLRKHHICPRAFSADQRGWELLHNAWSPRGGTPTTLCPGFTRVVERKGIVLNITELTHD